VNSDKDINVYVSWRSVSVDGHLGSHFGLKNGARDMNIGDFVVYMAQEGLKKAAYKKARSGKDKDGWTWKRFKVVVSTDLAKEYYSDNIEHVFIDKEKEWLIVKK